MHAPKALTKHAVQYLTAAEPLMGENKIFILLRLQTSFTNYNSQVGLVFLLTTGQTVVAKQNKNKCYYIINSLKSLTWTHKLSKVLQLIQ